MRRTVPIRWILLLMPSSRSGLATTATVNLTNRTSGRLHLDPELVNPRRVQLHWVPESCTLQMPVWYVFRIVEEAVETPFPPGVGLPLRRSITFHSRSQRVSSEASIPWHAYRLFGCPGLMSYPALEISTSLHRIAMPSHTHPSGKAELA